MRKLLLLSTITLLGLSTSTLAETVYFPEEIVPLQVGDKKVEHSFFSRVDELELAPGSYKFKLKYTDLYEQGYDAHQVVDSEPFWVSVTIAEGEDYDIVFNRADNAVAAKVFAESPQVSLQARGSSLGIPLDSASAPQQTQQAKAQVAPTAQTQAVAVAPIAVNAPVSKPSPTNAVDGAPNAAAMLDFWWQQASPQQQQAFLDKVRK
ncbi:DUF2057 domain-containing protein [Pseudoalteromonas shioyasakiensis]|uniref:DUF2057 family protein n=1 Tax=Pseudoalteromonas shioyasakiensis TaxID=1190813 RepID=UPI002117FE45|nr:DUF2057 family protein [Pseudoalteromonas shioyasakiensis]MCQ8880119.1 DUF2057 domain-containing protein [Pseudoalteromonas shioyasakiensis]